MTRTSRRVWAGLALVAALGAVGLVGCSGSGGNGSGPEALGQMSLPLTTQAASGTKYRLRDATFVVQRQDWYYDEAEAGTGGTSSNGTVTVSSETNPDAQNISLSLEEGYYYVTLQNGWHMEKQTASGAQNVEATLLSGGTQWVYVARQGTSSAEFSFGIGGRAVWLNGKLNIGIDVHELGEGGAGGAVEVAGAGDQ